MIYSANRKTQQKEEMMPRGRERPACTVNGCDKPHFGNGMCSLHYQRWRSTGTTDHDLDRKKLLTVKEKMVELMLSGIRELDDGCWICVTAYPVRGGYTRMQITEARVVHRVQTHRVSFEHFKGAIGPRMFICHTCDYRPCCNPAHLFQGTPSDNTRDMVRKGRGLVGELNMNAKVTEAQVLSMYQDEDCGMRVTEIARKYGVKPEAVSHILSGRNWKHLFSRRMLSKPA